MKVLITGAHGLLGQKLCARLAADPEIELIHTARKKMNSPIKGGSFFLMDVADRASVDNVLRATNPELIIHTAAMTQVDECEKRREECWRNNVTAVEYLVEGCKTFNSFFVQLSTDFVFDGSRGPLDEEEIPNPVNYYGESKLAAERIVQQSGLDWAIVRTVLVYGNTFDLTRSNIVLWVKKSLEAGKPISVVNDQWRTPTLAEDLAEGCYLIAKKKAKGIFHISGKEMMTPYQIAVEVAQHFKLNESLITATDSNQFRQTARRPLKTGFNIGKAKRELNFLPHSFREGLVILSSQLR